MEKGTKNNNKKVSARYIQKQINHPTAELVPDREGWYTNVDRIRVQPLCEAPLSYTIRISGDIHSEEFYHEEFEILENATENDLVIFEFASGGGSFWTAIAFVDKIRGCNAKTVANVIGQCASAASMIALACDELYIGDYCSFMIHQPSGGVVGPFQEMHGHSDHLREIVEDFYHDIYEGFLSEDEIKAVLSGSTVWIRAKGVRQRIETREELQAEAEKPEVIVCTSVVKCEMDLFTKDDSYNLYATEEDILLIECDGVFVEAKETKNGYVSINGSKFKKATVH